MVHQLRLPTLVMIGLGTTVGAGVFVITGTVAAHYTGPAVALSFLVASLLCLCPAACYAEFAAMTPEAAGAYTFATVSMGTLIGWLTGWCVLLEYLMAAATLAVGWSGYFCSFLEVLGFAPAREWTASVMEWQPGHGLHRTAAAFNLPAAAIVLLLTAVLCTGTRESARVGVTVVSIKLLTILAIIAFGALHANAANWHPFLPPNTGQWGSFGLSGVVRGASVVFVAYLGFDVVAAVAREVQNPQRVVPRAILAIILICTALYLLMALILCALIPYGELDVPSPVTLALQRSGLASGPFGAAIAAATLVGLTSGIFGILLGQSRVFLAMSQHGLLPAAVSQLSERTHSPIVATAWAGVPAAVLAGLFPINVLSELISIGTLAVFVVVCVGVIVMRHRAPLLSRPFRVRCSPLVPVAGVLGCLMMMASLPNETQYRFGAWLGAGILIYALRRMWAGNGILEQS